MLFQLAWICWLFACAATILPASCFDSRSWQESGANRGVRPGHAKACCCSAVPNRPRRLSNSLAIAILHKTHCSTGDLCLVCRLANASEPQLEGLLLQLPVRAEPVRMLIASHPEFADPNCTAVAKKLMPLWSQHPPYPVAGVLPRTGTRWKPVLAQLDLGSSAVRTGSLFGGRAALSRLESAFNRTKSAGLTRRPSSDLPSASRLHPNGIRALCIWLGVVHTCGVGATPK